VRKYTTDIFLHQLVHFVLKFIPLQPALPNEGQSQTFDSKVINC
jgi:hypothetical protein